MSNNYRNHSTRELAAALREEARNQEDMFDYYDLPDLLREAAGQLEHLRDRVDTLSALVDDLQGEDY